MKIKFVVGILFLCFFSTGLLEAQTPCVWRQVTKISNKILNDDKIKKGIFEESNEQMSAIGFGADTALRDVAFVNDKNGWITSGAGIFLMTRNGGESWTTKKLKTDGLSGIFFIDERHGWAVGRNNKKIAVYETFDGGKIWKLNQPVQKYELSNFSQVRFFNNQIGWAVGETERPGSDSAVFKTTDGGKSWELQYTENLDQDGSTYFADVEIIDENNVIAVGDRTLLKTTDGGATWKKVYDSNHFYFFSDIEFVSPTDGWVVGAQGIIMHTTDGGTTWTEQKIEEVDQDVQKAYTAVKFINQQEGWIAGWLRDLSDDGMILHTTDGGKTWKIEKKAKNLIIQKMTATAKSIFAVGKDGLIVKRNIKECS